MDNQGLAVAENRHSRVCLVTGATRGIGAATALMASQRGYAVCINYRAAESDARALAEAIERSGGRAVALRADVSREDDVAELFSSLDRSLGRVTALVNNAGISGGRRPFAETGMSAFRDVIDVNLTGTFLCMKEAVARMAKSRGGAGGTIVNLSSRAAHTGGFRLAPYVAAKAAIEGLTRAVAAELASDDIRVNCVSPGVVATSQQPLADPAWLEKAKEAIPLGRLGTPEEVAAAILWLLSDEASYVTGTIMDVSGGR